MKIQIAELTEQDKKERKLPKVTITFGGFKNMKIQINDQQQLDEVVKELDRLGYRDGKLHHKNINEVVSYDTGRYQLLSYISAGEFKETTLAELKDM